MSAPASEIILHTILFSTLYIQVLLLFTFLEKKPQKDFKNVLLGLKDKKTEEGLPSVAIIVPCWNEEKTLAGTVRSLLALDYPKEKLEILVVDDGSTDSTLVVAKQFETEPQVKIFSKENGGKHTALNLGIANSKSEFVGCLDADAFVEKDTLREIIREFQENSEIMAVTPAIRVHEPKTILQKIQRVEYNMGIFLRKVFGKMNAITVTPGPFSIFRRKVFEDLGEYKKAHNTEDMEYAMRMHKHHYPIGNASTAFVHTVTPATLRALIRQRLRWVHGFLRNAYDYRGLFLKKEYGNVGMFSLPIAVFSIFTVLYYTTVMVAQTASSVSEKALAYTGTGISWPDSAALFLSPIINQGGWFFWNTNMTNVLVFTLFLCAIAIVFLGHRMAEGKMEWHVGLLYFFLFYGILAPIWIFRAVYSVLLSRKSTWR